MKTCRDPRNLASSRCWRSSLLLLLVVLETCLRWTAGQTVTVSPSNVIAIRGVDGHDFTKFCSVTGIRLDLQTNIRLSECI
ncbi:hypothetical protein GBAR_LOCUS17004 [Geodia barretti]|uniref:Uncharacterized protein n=1 Tax=Geodia barretti TaxID=519541 RepID=A0AA35SIB7_GEOBA|nr:hypothetical protein GBAR_LOCUS17004 [Geodia barretti]